MKKQNEFNLGGALVILIIVAVILEIGIFITQFTSIADVQTDLNIIKSKLNEMQHDVDLMK